ncbi:MAG: hypothetical protein U1E87_04130 [Alphaproteobacteria bacterium]
MPFDARAAQVRDRCPATDADDYFVPDGVLTPEERYAAHSLLKVMEEPSLSCGVGESYRFIWDPSFDNPIAVRIDREGGIVKFHAVELLGIRESQKPRSLARKEGELSQANWDELQKALADAKFWSLGHVKESPGLDGASWTFEGRRGQAYTAFERWSPTAPDSLHDLGKLFLKLGDKPTGPNIPY